MLSEDRKIKTRAQLRETLAIECARPVALINRMGGNVPTVEEIVNRTMDAIKGGK